jgi:hypothetical protein
LSSLSFAEEEDYSKEEIENKSERAVSAGLHKQTVGQI